MKYYLAPMEGITGYIYRNAYEKHFGNIDKYFTPFIVPNQNKTLKTKELRDMLPENNVGLNIVPQILTNDSEGFIDTTVKLKMMGYSEVNLNLGCPSRTVVSKGRGSGFLALRDELDKFLEEIFKIEDMKISIKTRIGRDNPEEFYELIKIYNKYPMEELIIHPRTQKDYYGNKPNLEVFGDAVDLSKNTLTYNGDIFTAKDYENITKDYPTVTSVMLARGLIANPGLISEIKNNTFIHKNSLKGFHDDILNGYLDMLKDEKNSLYKMKELWGYMIYLFDDNKKYGKKIRKSEKMKDYNEIIEELFNEKEIIEGYGLFNNRD